MGPGDPGCKNSRFALFRRFGPFWTRLSLQEIVNHGQKNKIDYFCSRDGLETWWNSPPNQWNTRPNRLFLHPGCNRLFFRAEICRLTNLIDYSHIQHQRPKNRDDMPTQLSGPWAMALGQQTRDPEHNLMWLMHGNLNVTSMPVFVGGLRQNFDETLTNPGWWNPQLSGTPNEGRFAASMGCFG